MIKKRKARTIPFGWRDLGENLETIPEEIEALEIARWYIHAGYTLQSTRDWLVNETGRQITVPGLVKAIKNVKAKNPSKETTGQAPEPL